MSRNEQKNREVAHLIAFKESISDFPSGEIPRDQENPDFSFDLGHKVVGIEHTEIFHEPKKNGRTLQARETYIFKILNKARQIYEASDYPPVVVWLRFTLNARLGIKKVDLISERVAKIVQANIPEVNHSKEIRHTWDKDDILPKEISLVKIINFKGRNKSGWAPVMSGFQPDIPSYFVQQSIDKKNNKVLNYRKKCDEIWLLIVVYGLWPSTLFDVSGDALAKSYTSDFDRTYLFDFQNRKVFRLNTDTPG